MEDTFMKSSSRSRIGFALSTTLLGALTGCYVDGPYARDYSPPPPVYVEGGPVVQDDYVYYPGYQVYYSSNRLGNASLAAARFG